MDRRRMVISLLAMLTLVAYSAMPACSTGEKVRDANAASGYPQPLTIELHVSGTERRYVYYVVDRKGVLHYAGGRNANLRQADPVGKLSDEQLRYLWQVIDRYKLLDGSGELLPKGEKVYELKLNAGGDRASYNTAKTNLAGLDHLDKALFKMQGEIRYSDVGNAIDERIQRSGGAVKKQ